MTSILFRWKKALGVGRNLRGVVGVRAASGAKGVLHKSTVKEKDASTVVSVPSEADVVVVGGGMLGCSALYHLAKLGVTNTVLLEAHQLTAGTTWHTAGLMYRLTWSEMEFLLKDITYQLLLRLEEETGVDPGWTNNGSLFIASKEVAVRVEALPSWRMEGEPLLVQPGSTPVSFSSLRRSWYVMSFSRNSISLHVRRYMRHAVCHVIPITHEEQCRTTWHTAGLMHRLTWSEMEFLLKDITYQLLLRLEEETGVDPGWTNNSSLYIASKKKFSKERREDFQRVMTLGRVCGVESHMLDPSQIQELYPLMNVRDLECALYCPTDGSMDPAGVCRGLTRAAKRAGARVAERCPVTDVKTTETTLGGRRVSEVHTPYGVIKTNVLINATGAWANDISNKVGVDLPLQSFRHGYVVTQRIPGIENMPNARDYNASCYLKLQGDGLTIGGFEENPVPIDKLSPDFPFGLYEPDMDIVSDLLQEAAIRVPALENTGIKSTVYGPESFTPDNKPIVGEDPNVQGFFHCCAFNSHGMQLGGGCGDQIAKWVVHGRPEMDLFSLDLRRFHPPLTTNKAWVLARSHEGLTRNYSLKFPNDEPLAGRRQRCSPLHQVLEDAGCVFQERQGWERPAWFGEGVAPVQEYDWYGAYNTPLSADQRYNDSISGDCSFDFPAHHDLIQNECLACRETAAIFDMTSFGKLYLTGPDAQKAADWVFSADVSRAPGTTVYTCMLNHRGGTEADLTVSICEGGEGSACDPSFDGRGFYLTTGGSTGNYNKTHILMEARAHGWDVQVLDITEHMSLLSVQGPQSRTILQQVTDEDLSNEAFPFSTHKVITIAGHKARALRLTFVGEMGWEVHVPRASALAVYEAVVAAGRPLGLVNAGFRALDSLSCEKGYRHWHGDVRPDDSPLEAGLAFTCKLNTDTKFLGREALEQQKTKGVCKRLVTLTLDDPSRPLWGLEAIRRDGEIVGYIRRAEYAFTLGRSIAFGYVQRPDGGPVTTDFLKTGRWQLESMLNLFDATLHVRSPFDPKNLRVKGIYDSDPVVHTASG